MQLQDKRSTNHRTITNIRNYQKVHDFSKYIQLSYITTALLFDLWTKSMLFISHPAADMIKPCIFDSSFGKKINADDKTCCSRDDGENSSDDYVFGEVFNISLSSKIH